MRVYRIGNDGFLGLSHHLFHVAVSVVRMVLSFQHLGSFIILLLLFIR